MKLIALTKVNKENQMEGRLWSFIIKQNAFNKLNWTTPATEPWKQAEIFLLEPTISDNAVLTTALPSYFLFVNSSLGTSEMGLNVSRKKATPRYFRYKQAQIPFTLSTIITVSHFGAM